MSWLSSILTGLFGVAQQASQNLFNKSEAQTNRDFQSNEAAVNRAFQSNEAALQRDWSSAEAERARDWEEEMYAKYNSLSGKVAQAEQAGVNPLFAVTGNAVSPMNATSSAPSGASAGSVGTPAGSAASAQFVDIIGGILNAKKTSAEVDLLNAEANDLRSKTPLSVQKLISEISNIDADTHVKGATVDNVIQQTKNLVKSSDLLTAQLSLTVEQADNFKASTNKLIAETESIDSIRDSNERSAKAKAIVDEYEASIAKLVDDLSGDSAVETKDLASAIVKIMLKKLGV